MNLIVPKQRIKSYTHGRIYAEDGHILKLLDQREHVGLFYNLFTKQSFPTNMNNVRFIDSRLYIKPLSDEEIKSKHRRSANNKNQLLLF